MFELILSSIQLQIGIMTLIMLLFSYVLVKYLTYTTPNPNAKICLTDKDPNYKLKGYKRQDLSIHELKRYDGKHAETNFVIFVAVNGFIFDVTVDRNIYGPGGHYNVLAGRDASRALSTFTISCDAIPNEEDLMPDLSLTELAQLNEWYAQFSERYQCVGRLIRSNQERYLYDHSDEENVDESDDNIDDDIDKYCGIQSEVLNISSSLVDIKNNISCFENDSSNNKNSFGNIFGKDYYDSSTCSTERDDTINFNSSLFKNDTTCVCDLTIPKNSGSDDSFGESALLHVENKNLNDSTLPFENKNLNDSTLPFFENKSQSEPALTSFDNKSLNESTLPIESNDDAL